MQSSSSTARAAIPVPAGLDVLCSRFFCLDFLDSLENDRVVNVFGDEPQTVTPLVRNPSDTAGARRPRGHRDRLVRGAGGAARTRPGCSARAMRAGALRRRAQRSLLRTTRTFYWMDDRQQRFLRRSELDNGRGEFLRAGRWRCAGFERAQGRARVCAAGIRQQAATPISVRAVPPSRAGTRPPAGDVCRSFSSSAVRILTRLCGARCCPLQAAHGAPVSPRGPGSPRPGPLRFCPPSFSRPA